ncbi:VOC family protein [Paraglaciecola hydrolytica]|uniref:Glyoxalase n=1 Tax=Paraglaciecola hydrolytica TaxID=1799789 RepID=A0A136A0P6_9ALTE|nr:VOC family protein [Paraglaciecola hydrolytica]KXI28791.1 glyoxalase [Paraglaciecola hydrolytica]
MEKNEVGNIAWFDLTVADADSVKEFYKSVIGWQENPIDMGGYNDYSMQTPDSLTDVAGICHARGPNKDLPAQWLLYFKVADLKASIHAVTQAGGEVLMPVKNLSSSSHYTVIKDPAGAVCAIYADI